MTPTLYMLIGLPASGKSTIAQQIVQERNAAAIIHSSDKLREELYGDINDKDHNQNTFNELHKRIKQHLNAGISVIYDATNINRKRRMSFLRELKNIECTKIAILAATPYEQCLKYNEQRERKVPRDVILKMYKSFNIPALYEGFDSIEIKWNQHSFPNYSIEKRLYELKEISHDNPHHNLTIGAHCQACCLNMFDSKRNEELVYAALLHDFGKPFSKFYDPVTQIAHYYNHEYVGAYDALFYLFEDATNSSQSILYICDLIQNHMKPFEFEKSTVSEEKFINIVGQDFYDDLMLLHKADVKASIVCSAKSEC